MPNDCLIRRMTVEDVPAVAAIEAATFPTPCNIGGLGTLIASLASLISYRYYVNLKDAKKGKYFWTFTFYNLVFLLLIGFAGYLLLKIQ